MLFRHAMRLIGLPIELGSPDTSLLIPLKDLKQLVTTI